MCLAYELNSCLVFIDPTHVQILVITRPYALWLSITIECNIKIPFAAIINQTMTSSTANDCEIRPGLSWLHSSRVHADELRVAVLTGTRSLLEEDVKTQLVRQKTDSLNDFPGCMQHCATPNFLRSDQYTPVLKTHSLPLLAPYGIASAWIASSSGSTNCNLSAIG